MSHALFSRNEDLKRLRQEGYLVQVIGGFLVMREVPYVDSKCEVKLGTLISSLALSGDQTSRPDTHVIHFDGDFPCSVDGAPIKQISHQSGPNNLGHNLTARHLFSSKPDGGYSDYFHKMTTYAAILSGPAAVISPEVTPRIMRVPDEEEESVFNYIETASDRVGIGDLSDRLKDDTVAIIGCGGTGSYILDLVSKTPVQEIRLFDDDDFFQHNAFRTPGAASIEDLREVPKKVHYLKDIYSRIHRGIVAHDVALGASNLSLLDGVTFAFISMDAGEEKRLIIEKLEVLGASFVDVGMGLELDDSSLGGILRVTASTPTMRKHVYQGRVSFAGGGENDLYSSNIQVADLNSLNATLAVMKWKKIRGFYRDLEQEHHCTYTTDGNMLLNGDLE